MCLQAAGCLAILRLAGAQGKGRLCDWAAANVSAKALTKQGYRVISQDRGCTLT